MRTKLFRVLCVSALLFTEPGFGQVEVKVEVNKTVETTDDYLCWSPIEARIRLVGAAADTDVTVSSSQRPAGGNQGEVWFQSNNGSVPTWTTFAPLDALPLTLPSNGDWVNFWVAGKSLSAGNTFPDGTVAVDGKDTLIIVKDNGESVLLQHTVMVRIRKNAESLTPEERDRFLEALKILHDVKRIGQQDHDTKYLKYVKAHGEAFEMGIHNVPAFGPWHRMMLLSIERELQTIDPSVSLPYWKFDAVAPKLFSKEFIGIVGTGSTIVTFDSDNPIDGWKMPTDGQIFSWSIGNSPPDSSQSLRRINDASGTFPPVDLNTVLNSPNYSVMVQRLEGSYHNNAHNHVNGWLGDVTSPKDPLFFLLHANVDRAWQLWQKKKSAFNHDDPMHYFPLGIYATGSFHQGSFADDDQWPWNMAGGNQGTGDRGDDWPEMEFALPGGFANHGPSTIPLTKESIDFMNSLGTRVPLNFSYDDIPYRQ